MPNRANDIKVDKPIKDFKEDRFRRQKFCESITALIDKYNDRDSLVIGLYGKWGEGKTSIINLIHKNLKDENVIKIKFNPWRFPDETSLLMSFFRLLASKVSKSHIKDDLKTLQEEIGENLVKYSKLLSATPIGKMLEGIGSLLTNDADVEEIKTRLDEKLRKLEKKIFISIDDIDRLDKREVYHIFRLVKLTANFPNIIYLLAFDKEIVINSIKERYNEGDRLSGEKFLDKIIQVPIEIPKIQTLIKRKLFFETIDSIFDDFNLSISDSELKRIVYNFSNWIIPYISTAREIKRFRNSISLLVVLLKDEANIADLFLIQAIRLLEPNYYNYIRNNYHLFTQRPNNLYDQVITGKTDRQNMLKESLKQLETIKKDHFKRLLIELFPKMQKLLNNYSSSNTEVWYEKKRICSPRYFERYFTYGVLEGQVSDTQFKEFIQIVKSSKRERIEQALYNIINHIDKVNEFISRLVSYENDFNWDQVKKLLSALVNKHKCFPENDGDFEGGTLFSSSQNLRYFVIKEAARFVHEKDFFEYLKKLLFNCENLTFRYYLLSNLISNENKQTVNLSVEQIESLEKEFIKILTKKLDKSSIFDKYKDLIRSGLDEVVAKYNRYLLNKQTEEYMNKKEENVLSIIKLQLPQLCTGFINRQCFYGDLTVNVFNNIKKCYDIVQIKKKIEQLYDDDQLKVKPEWQTHPLKQIEDINIARQFYYHCKNDTSNTIKK